MKGRWKKVRIMIYAELEKVLELHMKIKTAW